MSAVGAAPSGNDFPYCAGDPVGFSATRWVVLALSPIAGLLILVLVPAPSFQAQLLNRLLFVGLPLGTLIWAAGPHAAALFGKFTGRDALVAVLAAALAILCSLASALVVQQFASVAPNPLAASTAGMSAFELAHTFLSTAPQLLGEELLTILPFLAILRLAVFRLGLGRRSAIALALLGSTLIFCAAHLPTYAWNWAQCFGVIGAARVVLTLAYIATRKLWVSTVAHILPDWTEFSLVFLDASHPQPH